MLTILIRYRQSKREVLFNASSVEYSPSDGLLLQSTDTERTDNGIKLDFTAVDSTDFRDVFVMNTAGSTVARYCL